MDSTRNTVSYGQASCPSNFRDQPIHFHLASSAEGTNSATESARLRAENESDHAANTAVALQSSVLPERHVSADFANKRDQVIATLFHRIYFFLREPGNSSELDDKDLFNLSAVNMYCLKKSKEIWKSLMRHVTSVEDKRLSLNIEKLSVIDLRNVYSQINRVGIPIICDDIESIRKIVFNNYPELLKLAIFSVVNIDAPDDKGFTLLMDAALIQEDIRCLRVLIEAGADIHDARNDLGYTALMCCAKTSGCHEALELLIASSANIEARDNVGATPLMHTASWFINTATQEPEIRSLKILINAGADVNARDNLGRTALMYVVYPFLDDHSERQEAIEKREFGDKECAQILLSAGADPTVVNHEGVSAVDWAIMFNHEATPMLISNIAARGRINEDAFHGKPLIIHMAYKGREDIVRMCLGAGADINAIDKCTLPVHGFF